MHPQLEPHFNTVMHACSVSCELADLLPDCDIVEELRAVLNVQHEIFCEMIGGRHFGTAALERFNRYLDELKENTENINR
jgi:hypothetical protein